MENEKLKTRQILPEYSKDDFIREVWKNIVSEAAPHEMLEKKLSDVKECFVEVISDIVNAEYSYTASVGSYKKRYITERDRTGSVISKREEEELQIDPIPVIGKGEMTSEMCYNRFSGEKFYFSAEELKNYNVIRSSGKKFYFSAEELENCNVTKENDTEVDSALKEQAEDIHQQDINSAVYSNLIRSYDYVHMDLKVTKSENVSSTMYHVPLWEVSIEYNGKTYAKKAYPIGKMEIFGDEIDIESKDQYLEKKKNEFGGQDEKNVWEKTKPLEYSTWGVIALSAILSLSVRSVFVSVAGLICAAGLFLFSWWKTNNEWKRLQKISNSKLEAIQKEYIPNRIAIVNNQLKSLNIEPIKVDDMPVVEKTSDENDGNIGEKADEPEKEEIDADDADNNTED